MVSKVANNLFNLGYAYPIEIAKCALLPISVCPFYLYDKNYFLNPDTTGRGIAFVTVVNTAIYTISYYVIRNYLSKSSESEKEKQLREKQRKYTVLISKLETIHNEIREGNVEIEKEQVKSETNVKGLETTYETEDKALGLLLENTNTKKNIDELIVLLGKIDITNTDKLKSQDIEDCKRALVLIQGPQKDEQGHLVLDDVYVKLQSVTTQLSNIQDKMVLENKDRDIKVKEIEENTKSCDSRIKVIQKLRENNKYNIITKKNDKLTIEILLEENKFDLKQLDDELKILNIQKLKLSADKTNIDSFKEGLEEAEIKYNEDIFRLEQIEKDFSKISEIKKHHKSIAQKQIKGSFKTLKEKDEIYKQESEKFIKRNGELRAKEKRVKSLEGYYDKQQDKQIQGLLELKTKDVENQNEKIKKNLGEVFDLEKKNEELLAELGVKKTTSETNEAMLRQISANKELLSNTLKAVEITQAHLVELSSLQKKAQSSQVAWKSAYDNATDEAKKSGQKLSEASDKRAPLLRDLYDLEDNELKSEQKLFKTAVNPNCIKYLEKVAEKCKVLSDLYGEKYDKLKHDKLEQHSSKWLEVNQVMAKMYEAKIALAIAKKMLTYNLLKLGERGSYRTQIVELKHQQAVLCYQRHLLLEKRRISTESNRDIIKKQIISLIQEEIKYIYKYYKIKIQIRKESKNSESDLIDYSNKCSKKAMVEVFELILTLTQCELERRTNLEDRQPYYPTLTIKNYLADIYKKNYLFKFRNKLNEVGYKRDLGQILLEFFEKSMNESKKEQISKNQEGQKEELENWVKSLNITRLVNEFESILTDDKKPKHLRIEIIKKKAELINYMSSKPYNLDNEKFSEFITKKRNPYELKKYELKKEVEAKELEVIKSMITTKRSQVSNSTAFFDLKNFFYCVPVIGLCALYQFEWMQKWPRLNAYVSSSTVTNIWLIMTVCHVIFQSAFPTKMSRPMNAENALEMN